jgi:hypothetical protein
MNALKNTFHFSVDDVFDALLEVTDDQLRLLDHPFFCFLQQIHDDFDTKIGCHLFYQKKLNGNLRTLKEVSSVKDQLPANNPWLFFAPHALEYETLPYAQSVEDQIQTFDKIYREIDRIAGSHVYTQFLRLHYYSESYEVADYFRTRGVKALFATHREVGSYRMPHHVARKLLEDGYANYQGMNFIRTQFKVECLPDENVTSSQVMKQIADAYDKYGFITFYTHECDMMNEKGRDMARLMFDAVRKLNLRSIERP